MASPAGQGWVRSCRWPGSTGHRRRVAVQRDRPGQRVERAWWPYAARAALRKWTTCGRRAAGSHLAGGRGSGRHPCFMYPPPANDPCLGEPEHAACEYRGHHPASTKSAQVQGPWVGGARRRPARRSQSRQTTVLAINPARGNAPSSHRLTGRFVDRGTIDLAIEARQPDRPADLGPR